jgi:hypothetical protein
LGSSIFWLVISAFAQELSWVVLWTAEQGTTVPWDSMGWRRITGKGAKHHSHASLVVIALI